MNKFAKMLFLKLIADFLIEIEKDRKSKYIQAKRKQSLTELKLKLY